MGCAALPVIGARLLSPYGAARGQGGEHHGVDLKAPEGAAVFAMLDGVVRVVAKNGELERYGVCVVIDHGPYLSLYAHLRAALVTVGEDVRQGQQIGTVGRTAGTKADPDAQFTRERAHLHLEFLTRWPVHQGGAGRLDPGPIFAELGIMVPDRGPIVSACNGGAVQVVAHHATKAARGAGGAVALLALFLLGRRLQR